MIVRVISLCLAAAMICSALRIQRPEIAAALSVAAGLAALWLTYPQISEAVREWSELRRRLSLDDDLAQAALKAAGITVLSELGAQICTDAGECALGGRILLAARVAILGLCAPMLAEIAAMLQGALR